jgi:hypothetical protein
MDGNGTGFSLKPTGVFILAIYIAEKVLVGILPAVASAKARRPLIGPSQIGWR